MLWLGTTTMVLNVLVPDAIIAGTLTVLFQIENGMLWRHVDQLHGRDQSSNNESCTETVYTSTDSSDENTNNPS